MLTVKLCRNFFRKWVLANQRGERCFVTCDKNDTPNQKPQTYVCFEPKFLSFIGACSLQRSPFADIQRENTIVLIVEERIILKCAEQKCLKEKNTHTLISEKRHKINKFANYQHKTVRNSPAFDRHDFVPSQNR